MKERCYSPNCKDYPRYGGKGITICDEWINDHTTFEQWAMDNGYVEGLTIDRINPDKGYSPDNCRWVTIEENTRFKSTTNCIEVNGEIKSGRQWAKELGYGKNYINTYLRKHGMEQTVAFILNS